MALVSKVVAVNFLEAALMTLVLASTSMTHSLRVTWRGLRWTSATLGTQIVYLKALLEQVVSGLNSLLSSLRVQF